MTALVRDDEYVVKTYRYLRCALVGLAAALVAAIVVDQVREQDEWLGSMSGYYYTSAHSWFVGALVAMGVCLVCLRGRSDTEDLLLNLAGMLAPVVAFVPTRLPRGLGEGPELPPGTDTTLPAEVRETAVSNVGVLCGLGFAGFAFLLALWLSRRGDDRRPALSVAGALVAAAVWLGATVALAREQEWFLDNAHNVAAITMFGFIAAVVALSSFGTDPHTRRLRAAYGVIAALMVLTALLLLLKDSWAHAILVVELTELGLFGLFWALQTGQHWDGNRHIDLTKDPQYRLLPYAPEVPRPASTTGASGTTGTTSTTDTTGRTGTATPDRPAAAAEAERRERERRAGERRRATAGVGAPPTG